MLNKMFDEFNNQYGLEKKALDSDLKGLFEIIGGEYDELRDEAPDNPMHNGELMILNPDNFVKEGIDLVYATLQQLRERGVDVDAALTEVHRSNMSKDVHYMNIESELDIARERYPSVEKIPSKLKLGYWIMKCSDTGKVVKPTTTSKARITDAMIGKE